MRHCSYVLINTEKRRSLSSLSPQAMGDAHSHLTPVRKRDILRTFYRTVVGNLIGLPGMLLLSIQLKQNLTQWKGEKEDDDDDDASRI